MSWLITIEELPATKGDREGALNDFTRAIKINGRQSEAYANRGLVRLEQGQQREADRDFSRAAELNPSAKSFIEKRRAELMQ